MQGNSLNMQWFKYGFLFLIAVFSSAHATSPWTWICVDKKCVKTARFSNEAPQGLALCKVYCDPHLNLWPRPTGVVKIIKLAHAVNPFNVSVNSVSDMDTLEDEMRKLVRKAGELFKTQLERQAREEYVSSDSLPTRSLHLDLNVEYPNPYRFSYDMDERYILFTRSEFSIMKATVIAPTIFGFRHGLQTLSQLVIFDEISRQFVIPGLIDVSDGPVYPYRGIMLDTSRRYFSVESIKRTLDAMAANKLNTFHWHITDAASFPFQSKKYPQFSRYGAYSPRKVYTHEDVRSVVAYGKERGILIVPELAAPAAVGEGWQWAPNAALCFKEKPWTRFCSSPPCGQLDPTSDRVYDILENLYAEFLSLFDSHVFHMGGDEVNFDCWNSSEAITKWMAKNKYPRTSDGFTKLWRKFQHEAYARLTKANGGKKMQVMLRSSRLSHSGQARINLDKENYIIQVWNTSDNELYFDAVQGFKIVLSNYEALYFDCGFGAWLGDRKKWCSRYVGWQEVYDNDPLTVLKGQGGNLDDVEFQYRVLGAEAAVFAEQTDEAVLDNRVWPRASALAERLWSRPSEDWQQAESRILSQRERLVRLGIKADRLEPEWCKQNQGLCSV